MRNKVLQQYTLEGNNYLADRLVEIAEIKDNDIILEPSAGQGAIIDSILKVINDTNNLFFCENIPTKTIILNRQYGAMKNLYYLHPLNDDFLNLDNFQFDKIIANPPLENNQDIDYVLHMYKNLKPGGILVSVMSNNWRISTDKKESEFKKWLFSNDYWVDEIKEDMFKDSGTMVGVIVSIKKHY